MKENERIERIVPCDRIPVNAKTKHTFCLLLVAFTACGPAKEASVTRNSDQARLPLVLNSLSGLREGYVAHGEMMFMDADSPDRLLIRFTLEPGVPTKFISGEFSWGAKTGEVTCSSIDFFGGQGGIPSIGGKFAMTTPDGVSYAVYLPTTEMKVKK